MILILACIYNDIKSGPAFIMILTGARIYNDIKFLPAFIMILTGVRIYYHIKAYSVRTNRNPAQSLQENAITVFGPR